MSQLRLFQTSFSKHYRQLRLFRFTDNGLVCWNTKTRHRLTRNFYTDEPIRPNSGRGRYDVPVMILNAAWMEMEEDTSFAEIGRRMGYKDRRRASSNSGQSTRVKNLLGITNVQEYVRYSTAVKALEAMGYVPTDWGV